MTTYTRVMQMAEKMKDDRAYSNAIRQIANVYAVFGDLERSYYYNNKAYEDAIEKKDKNLQALLLENLVGISYLQRNLPQMKKYIDLQMKTPMNDKTLWRFYQLCNQGYLAQLSGNSKLSLFYHKEALTLAKDYQMPPRYLTDQLNEIGKVYYNNQEYRLAVSSLLSAHELAKRHNMKEQDINILRMLTQTYEKEGKTDSAGFYKKLYLSIDDSLFDKRRFSMAQDSLFEYEHIKNDQHIHTLNTRITRMIWIATGIAFLLIVAIGITAIIVINNRRLVAAQRALIERNRQLLRSVEENKLLRKQYLNKVKETEELPVESAPSNKEYLNQDLRQILITRITTVMEDMHNISSPDFSLQTLARLVGSNTKYVSWVINDTYGKNFKSFLNEYRVREACRRLNDHKNYGHITLQALASDIGYNSPTSFIQAFKKINGMTPSEYQKLANSEE